MKIKWNHFVFLLVWIQFSIVWAECNETTVFIKRPLWRIPFGILTGNPSGDCLLTVIMGYFTPGHYVPATTEVSLSITQVTALSRATRYLAAAFLARVFPKEIWRSLRTSARARCVRTVPEDLLFNFQGSSGRFSDLRKKVPPFKLSWERQNQTHFLKLFSKNRDLLHFAQWVLEKFGNNRTLRRKFTSDQYYRLPKPKKYG